MTIEPGWMIGVFLTMVGLITGCYAYVRSIDVRETELRGIMEKLLEKQLIDVQESLNRFQRDVIDRLARIETKIENGAVRKKGGAAGSLE